MKRIAMLDEGMQAKLGHVLTFLVVVAADDLMSVRERHAKHLKGGSLADVENATERLCALSKEARTWLENPDGHGE